MIIDDSRAVRRILSRMLLEFGYEVCEAANGREGLALLERENAVCLILVDWNMPEMDGLGFVKCLRADSRYNSVKVVMVTTETELDRMVTALEAGADEYVMKPFTADIISDKLRLVGAL
jgi:two-component system chemotaxis response regulator CheY